MLNESASTGLLQSSRVAAQPSDSIEALFDSLQMLVSQVMYIDSVSDDPDPQHTLLELLPDSLPLVRFTGRLRLDAESAYAQLDAGCRPLDCVPIFRQEAGQHIIIMALGRPRITPRARWPHVLLVALTFLSLLLTGSQLNAQVTLVWGIQWPDVGALWHGLPYALALLLILSVQELAAYGAAWRHGLAFTLPYFVPFPFLSLFGTLGAYSHPREPIRNRKVLLDIGVAGPVAGVIVALPVLLIGLAHTPVGPLTEGWYAGDSVLYALAKWLTFGHLLPDATHNVMLTGNQLAWAGWTGLLVSAFSLIPVGQLDGGHVIFALLGERARYLHYPLLTVLIGLIWVSQLWALWVAVLLLLGRYVTVPLDMITPLDTRRRIAGWLTMGLFLLIITPAPFIAGGTPPPPPAAYNAVWLTP